MYPFASLELCRPVSACLCGKSFYILLLLLVNELIYRKCRQHQSRSHVAATRDRCLKLLGLKAYTTIPNYELHPLNYVTNISVSIVRTLKYSVSHYLVSILVIHTFFL